jgi:NAD-dependent deacetylase
MSDAARLAGLIRAAGPGGTVLFTGAGVSTESGIPDFRSPGGIWSRYAPIGYYEFLNDPAMRRESWQRGLHIYAELGDAQPNPAHLAIAGWHQAGLVSAVVTQNIDGLHQRAGMPDDRVIELHGNAHHVACLTCSARFTRQEVHARLHAGELEPDCPTCGGILKPTTISFGQPLIPEVVAQAERLMQRARLCLIVGSSLVVYPAAGLPELTLQSGGQLVIVNATETHLDRMAVLVSRVQAGVLFAEVSHSLSPRP